jgi:hypothetical protein
MKECKDPRIESTQDREKKQYIRPQLLTHGGVETVTQGISGGNPSEPC